MQLQYRTIDYINSLIMVGHGPTLLIIGGAMAYIAYAVPTPMTIRHVQKDKLSFENEQCYDHKVPVSKTGPVAGSVCYKMATIVFNY